MRNLVMVLVLLSAPLAMAETTVLVKQKLVELLPPGTDYVTYESDLGAASLVALRDLAHRPGTDKHLIVICDAGDRASLIATVQVIILRVLSGVDTHAIIYKADGSPDIARMFPNAKTVNSVPGITAELKAQRLL